MQIVNRYLGITYIYLTVGVKVVSIATMTTTITSNK